MGIFDKKKDQGVPYIGNIGGFRPLDLIFKSRGERKLETSEGVFSAITRLSSTVASTPFSIYLNGQKAMDHHLARLFEYEVAPGITPYIYKSTMETCRDVYGNAYALKVPGLDGRVERLDILDPTKVQPMLNRDNNEVYYSLQDNSAVRKFVHYKEMIHLRHVSTGGMQGVSPIDVLQNSLEYDAQMKEFSLNALQGINSCVTLEIPTHLNDDGRKKVIANFIENYKATSGGLIVLTGGTKANVITKSPVDSHVFDIERVTKGRIAAVYSLPPHFLGNFEHASYQTNEQQMLEFVQMAMHPIFKQYEEEHDLKLLGWAQKQEGYSFRFDADKMIIPTRLQMAQEAQYLVRSGQKTPNELRQERGDAPVKGGDTLFVSRDLAPAEYIVKNPDHVRGYR